MRPAATARLGPQFAERLIPRSGEAVRGLAMKLTKKTRSSSDTDGAVSDTTAEVADPVLQAIDRARQEYLRHTAEDQRLEAEIARLREDLAQSDEVRNQMAAEMAETRARLERLQRRAE